MMRRLNQLFTASFTAVAPRYFAIAISASAVLLSSGCRYATNGPVTPLGGGAALQPLNPIQGSPSFSPIQPTSGISTFGAPTRVPPPPTGSYQASINNPGAFNNGTNGYAPSNFRSSIPNQANAYVGSGLGNGAGGNGSFTGGVQQTGWVSNNNSEVSTSGFSRGVGASAGNNQPIGANPIGSTGATTTMRPRSGGMNVIDLTRAPSPPGYVAPQNRPGFQGFQNQQGFQNLPSQQSQSLGQPRNSTAPRSQFGPLPSTRPFNAPASDFGSTDPQFLEARLPSTEPFPNTQGNGFGDNSQELKWTRPSPRF